MKEVKCLYHKAVILSGILGVLIIAVVFLFTTPIVSVFNSEQNMELQKMAENGLRIYFVGFLFVGFNIVTASLFGAISQPKASFFLSVFRGCIGIILIVFLFSYLMGLFGVWITFPVVELLTLLIGIDLYKKILSV